MVGENEMVVVAEADARDLTECVFEAVGVRHEDAAVVADSLVWADLRGVSSHGMIRIPSYIERVENGVVNPRPDIRVIRSLPAARIVDGDHGYGQLPTSFAMHEAIDLARSVATGLVVVRGCAHTGAAGYYTRMAAEQGMIGMYVGGSRPSMAYYGARSKSAATNPLSLAVPAIDGGVLCLDMATSNIGVGQLRHHRATGIMLGEGWALDADGAPTTDPHAAAALTPAAGPKGAGMSLLFESMTSLLVGNALLAPALLGRSKGHAQNALVMAIDIASFTDLDSYCADVAELIDTVKSQPPASGVEAIMVPGERGDTTMARRREDGIPVPATTWAAIGTVAERLGVGVPTVTG